MKDEKEVKQVSGVCGSDCECNWEGMYKNELERNTTLEENNICYPVTVIKWRIARYLAMKGNNKALSLYRNARKQSLVNKKQSFSPCSIVCQFFSAN